MMRSQSRIAIYRASEGPRKHELRTVVETLNINAPTLYSELNHCRATSEKLTSYASTYTMHICRECRHTRCKNQLEADRRTPTELPGNDTWKRVRAAGVELLVPGGGHLEDVPLDARVVLLQVDPELDAIRLGRLVDVTQIDLRVTQLVSVWQP